MDATSLYYWPDGQGTSTCLTPGIRVSQQAFMGHSWWETSCAGWHTTPQDCSGLARVSSRALGACLVLVLVVLVRLAASGFFAAAFSFEAAFALATPAGDSVDAAL